MEHKLRLIRKTFLLFSPGKRGYLVEQVGYQRGYLTSLGASERDVAKQRLTLQSFNYRGNSIVTTNSKVVALSNIVSEDHP